MQGAAGRIWRLASPGRVKAHGGATTICDRLAMLRRATQARGRRGGTATQLTRRQDTGHLHGGSACWGRGGHRHNSFDAPVRRHRGASGHGQRCHRDQALNAPIPRGWAAGRGNHGDLLHRQEPLHRRPHRSGAAHGGDDAAAAAQASGVATLLTKVGPWCLHHNAATLRQWPTGPSPSGGFQRCPHAAHHSPGRRAIPGDAKLLRGGTADHRGPLRDRERGVCAGNVGVCEERPASA
mmetsp:Transcript_85559/g.190164  ORF Transcript_85559/g.190164 Transcript_85559/m.190164 type:complete len:238 (-) Transcript_85559:668-1381(-)